MFRVPALRLASAEGLVLYISCIIYYIICYYRLLYQGYRYRLCVKLVEKLEILENVVGLVL